MSHLCPQWRPATLALSALAFSTLLLSARPAHAQDLAVAEELFAEGKALMKAGETAKACEKFEASHDIDKAATGTLLNLALCHEAIGKTATAWAEFRQVIAESAHREDRVLFAREHETKLFLKLAYVVVAVRPSARIEGLRITLDGKRPLPPAAWGAQLPIDPGHHTLDVDASGMIAKRYEVDVPDKPGDQTVDVEPLVPAPSKAGAKPPIGDDYAALHEARLRKRRTVGYILGGVGIVAAGVGGTFGVLAITQNDKQKQLCPVNCPDQDTSTKARTALDNAKTFALVSDIGIGVGAALIVAGGVLLLTSSPKPSAQASDRTSVRLSAGPNGGGVLLERAW